MTARKLLDAFKVQDEDVVISDAEDCPDEPTVKAVYHEKVEDLVVWTNEEWARITGFSCIEEDFFEGPLIRVHSDHGKTLDMQLYAGRCLDGKEEVPFSKDVPDEERHCATITEMSKHSICRTVYGDTDSIFVLFDSTHLEGEAMRVA
jgi:hypothetical protein